MKLLINKLLDRVSDFTDGQPFLALFLWGALLAVFLTALLRTKSKLPPETPFSLTRTLYHQAGRFIWALFLVTLLLGGMSSLRSYLRQTVSNFQYSHGRVTTANYNAVQTIWGAEQTQGELRMDLYWEEEVTDRIESEDLTKPAILRKKTVRHNITSNPFISARHDVTLRQNPRKKGSALYGGYETQCSFVWRLKNPTDRILKADLKFPLPASGAMYDDLTAVLNGQDILPLMQIKEASLALSRELKGDEALDLKITFKSRGMSFWYLQVRESREIRDFTLTLNLPDLPQPRLNYPEGCMTPTDIKPTGDALGSVLTYRLDHAISSKGMGISLPTLPQPGAVTSAVLGETSRGWTLIFTMLVLGLTLASVNHAVLISILFGAVAALGYGFLGDFSDLLFGFWGTALVILIPTFLVLAALVKTVLPGITGRLMAYQVVLFGIVLPCLAGMDPDRESLYANICTAVLLAFIGWQLTVHLRRDSHATIDAISPAQGVSTAAAAS